MTDLDRFLAQTRQRREAQEQPRPAPRPEPARHDRSSSVRNGPSSRTATARRAAPAAAARAVLGLDSTKRPAALNKPAPPPAVTALRPVLLELVPEPVPVPRPKPAKPDRPQEVPIRCSASPAHPGRGRRQGSAYFSRAGPGHHAPAFAAVRRGWPRLARVLDRPAVIARSTVPTPDKVDTACQQLP